MTISAINREFVGSPNIVGIICDDDLTAITTAGYFYGAQGANVELLNNGVWQWATDDATGAITDLVLIFYATDQIGFFTYDATDDSFDALADNGGLSNTLLNTHVFVGNASNVATGVALSGDATIANTGALTISASAITTAKIAANAVTFAKLDISVLQTATVALTAAQIKALYDTPVLLIAAPASGHVIVIDSIFWDIAFVTTQYAAGGVIGAQYGNSAHGVGAAASAAIAAATLNGVAASGFLSQGAAALNAPATVEATGVYLSNDTGDFTTGDSTANLYIRYHVLTPA